MIYDSILKIQIRFTINDYTSANIPLYCKPQWDIRNSRLVRDRQATIKTLKIYRLVYGLPPSDN